VTGPRPEAFSFERYLAAKESVDDRAIHRPTLDRFRRDARDRADSIDRPLRVVEVGAGLGAMCRRLLDHDALPARVHYTLVDVRPALVSGAREALRAWASDAGVDVERIQPTLAAAAGDALRLVGPDRDATVEFVAGDGFEVLAAVERPWDVLVGAAFADLIPLSRLPPLFDALVPGGRFYFPVTFDGETTFRPVADSARAAAILDRFHETMAGPDRAGPRAGSDLFEAVPAAGGAILAAGGSDWVVHPPYPADEAYFCHHVIDIVESAVAETVDGVDDADRGTAGRDDAFGREALRAWATERHRAVADGALTYLAHNLDVYGRV
jgi:protein-L-isoaspartate O-methyltransferase